MDSEISRRQAQIEDVLDELRRCHSPAGIALAALPGADRTGRPRGAAISGPTPAAGVRSDTPAAWGRIEDLPAVTDVLVGEWIHLAVLLPGPGLHATLFGLGASGQVSLLPPAGKSIAGPLPADRWLYRTGDRTLFPGACPLIVTGNPYQVRRDGEHNVVTLGRAMGTPERILAIATNRRYRIRPGELHDDWRQFDPVENNGEAGRWDPWPPAPKRPAAANPWTSAAAVRPRIWTLPRECWTWGCVELPVRDSPMSGRSVRL